MSGEGERVSLICSFHFSMASRRMMRAVAALRYTWHVDGRSSSSAFDVRVALTAH